MKTKNFKKKLTLNKKNIAHLNNPQLITFMGGKFTGDTCDTCIAPDPSCNPCPFETELDCTNTCQTCPMSCDTLCR